MALRFFGLRREEQFYGMSKKKATKKPVQTAAVKEIVFDEASPKQHVFPSGAVRSGLARSFHLIPATAQRRIAERFELGSITYGEGNWKKALEDSYSAKPFLTDAYNHMVEHQLKMVEGVEPEDDHLGAIGWAVTVLCFAEEKYGMPWRMIGSGLPSA